MTARFHHARAVLGAVGALVLAGGVATADAQRAPQTGPRFMVATLRSAEKGLGVQAGEVIRSRLTSDVPLRTLWVIPKSDIVNTLEASGYSTTEALNQNDTRSLATILRAEEYLDALVTHTPTGYRVEGAVVLARDPQMVQPLPPVEAAKLDDAAKQLSREVQDARKQLENVQKCALAERQKQFGEALKAAQAAIQQYPRSAMARVCVLNVYMDQKASSDSVIKLAEEIVAINPTSRPALTALADAYKAKGQNDKYIRTLTQLLAADPSNTRLQVQVVNELGASGNAAMAIPIIETAVQQNPGDPQLMRLQWLVLLNAKQFKRATTVAEELARTDTSVADTSFYRRLAAAYTADSQPAKAAETLARAVQKFPGSSDLLATYASTLRSQGQNQQALAVLRRALAANSKIEHGRLIEAQILLEMNQPDSALAALRAARASGDSAQVIGQMALVIGNNLYKAANGTKNRGDFEKAIRVLSFSDSVSKSPQAKFLIGVSQLTVGSELLQEASKQKSCDLTREAEGFFTEAQINLPAGGAFSPDAAKQTLGSLAQMTGYVDQLKKAYCKGRGGASRGR